MNLKFIVLFLPYKVLAALVSEIVFSSLTFDDLRNAVETFLPILCRQLLVALVPKLVTFLFKLLF